MRITKKNILQNNVIYLLFIISTSLCFSNSLYAADCAACDKPSVDSCICPSGTSESLEGYCRAPITLHINKGRSLDYDGDCVEDSGLLGASSLDCDPTNPAIGPNVTEVCDGIDNNCDGQIDEGLTSTFYADTDGDGYGSPDNAIDSCVQPIGYVTDNTDCNNLETDIHPDAQELCDGIDNNCDGQIDENCPSCGNGIVETGEDCDDGNTTDGDGCSSTCTVEVAATSCPCWDNIASLDTIRNYLLTDFINPDNNLHPDAPAGTTPCPNDYVASQSVIDALPSSFTIDPNTNDPYYNGYIRVDILAYDYSMKKSFGGLFGSIISFSCQIFNFNHSIFTISTSSTDIRCGAWDAKYTTNHISESNLTNEQMYDCSTILRSAIQSWGL